MGYTGRSLGQPQRRLGGRIWPRRHGWPDGIYCDGDWPFRGQECNRSASTAAPSAADIHRQSHRACRGLARGRPASADRNAAGVLKSTVALASSLVS